MTVHIDEMSTTVDVEPERGGASTPAPAAPGPRAAREAQEQLRRDLGRLMAEGYAD